MLFNYPSFIGTKEQSQSELLYNNVRILLQTSTKEIWSNLSFGTSIREYIKQGIDSIVLTEIKDEIEIKLNNYFSDDIIIDTLNVWQDVDKIKVDLEYIELRTGVHKTLQQTEEAITIINDQI